MQNSEEKNVLERYKIVHDYSKEVWSEMLNKCFTSLIKVDKLPLYISEKLLGKNGEKYTLGRVSNIEPNNKKIIVIEISINPVLDLEEIKETIRHELIHFGLIISDLKSDDNSAVFNLLCEVFDAPSSPDNLLDNELQLYTEFKETFITRYKQINDITSATKFNLFITALGDKKERYTDLVKNFPWDL